MESQAIINTMEVLSTRPLTELVTEATVKVCWVSETPNDNGTVITKEVGKEIAATLPGAPVVGFFDPNTGDFSDHGKQIVIERNKVSIKDLTKPYGFVSPLEAPWYQDFLENGVQRTYLMCKAFLWTRQYEEARLIKHKGQSMELDDEDYNGYYENDDVFIFTHAVLNKLCVLGDDCPPCFDGANIVTTYSKSYAPFVDELEKILGKKYYVVNDRLVEKPVTPEFAKVIMESETINTENVVETEVTETVETPAVEFTEPVTEEVKTVETVEAQVEFAETPVEEVPEVQESVEVPTTEFAESGEPAVEEPQVEVVETPVAEVVDYAAINAELEQQIAEYKSLNETLQNKVTSLESELSVYQEKEKEQENNSKKEIIKEYGSLLSEDEIKPFEDKVNDYSLDELEAKLSVTYARKQRAALSDKNVQGMQVNVEAFNAPEDNLPEFMKKAMDYDRVNGL